MAQGLPSSGEPAQAAAAPALADPKAVAPAVHPRGAEAANDPEWALKFLAQVTTKAIQQNLLEEVPSWIYSQRYQNSLTGEISSPDNPKRDAVLTEVISSLILASQLSSTAATTVEKRWALYRDCATLGNVIIEGAAADRLLNVTLVDARDQILWLMNEAASSWDLLHKAAPLVVREFRNTSASVREPDLDALFYPKNLRPRDGSIADRLTRIRYVLAIRSLVKQAQPPPPPSQEQVDPIQQARGLTTVPLDRGTAPPPRDPAPDPVQLQKPALEFLGNVAMHPSFTTFITALDSAAASGRTVFVGMVAEAVADNGRLANSINSDTRGIWRFPAALRAGLATINNPRAAKNDVKPSQAGASPSALPHFALTAAEIDALTQYALHVAPTMKTSMEEALDALGKLVTVIELFGGPLAPIGLVADAIIQAAGAAVSFMQQVDQDRAESATIFKGQNDRLSTGGRYIEPAALGVGALVTAAFAGLAVRGALKNVTKIRASGLPTTVRAGSAAEAGTESAHVPTVTKGTPPKSAQAIESPLAAKAQEHLPEQNPTAPSGDPKPPIEPEVHGTKSSPNGPDDLKLSQLEGPDIAKPTAQEVEDARRALRDQLDAMVAQGMIDKPEFKDLVMSVQQEETFARLNGALLSGGGKQALPAGLSAERVKVLLEAEQRAASLRQRLATHWDAALPGKGKVKQTAEEAAYELYQELTKHTPETGTLNAAVRKSLYDNWRRRFIAAVSDDKELIRDLKDWSGVTFTPPKAKLTAAEALLAPKSPVTAFRVQAVGAKGDLSWVDLNFDHAFRHEEAVEQAFRTGDWKRLIRTVDSANVATNTGLENQVLKEGVVRENYQGWTIAPGPTPRAIQPFR